MDILDDLQRTERAGHDCKKWSEPRILETEMDADQPDSLLALPECP